MPTPKPRTPICIARGNLADLNANIGDLEEGEICYASDQNAHYMMMSGSLIKVTDLPSGNEWDIMQIDSTGDWVGSDQLNGGNF